MTNSYFSGKLNGVKVYGKITDPSRPTCGNVMTEGFDFCLIVDTDIEGFELHENNLSAFRAAKK
jgi:hypothetical protein